MAKVKIELSQFEVTIVAWALDAYAIAVAKDKKARGSEVAMTLAMLRDIERRVREAAGLAIKETKP